MKLKSSLIVVVLLVAAVLMLRLARRAEVGV